MGLVAGKKYILYQYSPSEVAAIIFIVLFGVVTALHTFQLLRKRTWYFIPFIIGGIFETIGYIGRALNATESYGNWTTGPYIAQSLTLLLAPALFAASIYMVLGRLITLVDGAAHSPVKVKWLTPIFVMGDVISFLAQSGGGGILAQAKKQSTVNLGEHVITAGLAIQVLFFVIFMFVTVIFHARMIAMPTPTSISISLSASNPTSDAPFPWKSYLYVLYSASTFILVRSVFRIAEYVTGTDGVLLDHEYYLYIFDSVLMFFVMVIFCVWHPSRIIVGKGGRVVADPESRDSTYELNEEHSVRVHKKH